MRMIDPTADTPAGMVRPPCWPVGKPCPNACARAYYHELVDNHRTLTGPWTGWRLAGRDLISPDRQRINPQRLRGLLFRQDAEARIARNRFNRNPAVLRAEQCRRNPAAIIPFPERLPARERFDGQA